MANETKETTVVVGAGHAGGELVAALRQLGYDGRIVMLGSERHLPYQRPPLSKGFLSGAASRESLYLRPEASYDGHGIELRPGVTVSAIDRAAKVVRTTEGEAISYDKLALATGGRPRLLQLPAIAADRSPSNLHYVRTIEDIDKLRSQMVAGRRLVIVGGGYIGLEVAAIARKANLRVTVLETMPRVLARVTAPELSAFYERIHRERGVEIHTGVTISRIDMEESDRLEIRAIVCDGGERHAGSIPADLVVAGIGLVPNIELAAEAGLDVDNGIVVDEFARTSDPSIYAAGDCANHFNGLVGRRVRLESVPNAVEQARAAAASIAGKPRPYDPMPWFWSDQYDFKLQMAGLSHAYDQLVLRGSTANSNFTAFYLKNGVVIAADIVNRPAEFMLAKRMISARMSVPADQLADEKRPLKDIVQQTINS